MHHFDETALVHELSRLTKNSRVAFAASCAQRLFPVYEDFCKRTGRGDPRVLGGILDRVWQAILGNEMTTEEVRSELGQCMNLIPGEEDEPWVEEQAYADDAASAVAYALRTMVGGDAREACWAACRAYEANDHYVTHALALEDERLVRSHPLIQTELARQRRDLDELLGADPGSREVLGKLRARARAEASLFLPSGPRGTPKSGQ